MTENLVIPPVPESREAQYAWIDHMVSLGWSVVRACEMAGVPKVSYYKLHKAKEEDPGTDTAEANDQSRDETHQDDRNSPDSTSVAMTKGDKAS